MERTSVVRAAMLVLSEDRRQVLIWKYVEGFSVDAIAVRLGRTAKAVESLLSRTREQMRALLRGYVMPCGDGRPTSKESPMSNPSPGDEEVLARLVRQAGDPRVSPEPQYAEARATILGRVAPAETAARLSATVPEADVMPFVILERTRRMRLIAKFAIAATVLVAVALAFTWFPIGGGASNMAFARVADALDHLRSATFDMTATVQKRQHLAWKGLFLAPSHQRMEMTAGGRAAAGSGGSIMVIDGQASKALMLMPKEKLAVTVDAEKLRKPGDAASPEHFRDHAAVSPPRGRCLGREGPATR